MNSRMNLDIASQDLPEELEVESLQTPFDATVQIPGSKSITNRALICAALASGVSVLRGVLLADDTLAMANCVTSMGAGLKREPHHKTQMSTQLPTAVKTAVAVGDFNAGEDWHIDTTAMSDTGGEVPLDVHMSGTTARFITAAAARFDRDFAIDGDEQMRARPMAQTVEALRSLGAFVSAETLPMRIRGPIRGGRLSVSAQASSQFASGMMLAAPGLAGGLEIQLEGEVVSRPYLDMTAQVMQAFGACFKAITPEVFSIQQTPYQAGEYVIEPDASAASYFFAAAALCQSRVVIPGLHKKALQGDVGFVEVLEKMGAKVTYHPAAIEVCGQGQLRGVDVDMTEISDTAQTLAAIAPFASSPTRVRGIGFIRNKETDRISAVVNELNRLGITARETDDGFEVFPLSQYQNQLDQKSVAISGVSEFKPSVVETYRDHRMAMSFAVLGLKQPGVTIKDPACVSKTFPTFWQTLQALR